MPYLHELVATLGVVGALLLITLLSGSVLLVLYLLLHFGETSLQQLTSFVLQMLSVLRYEHRKTNPAIRVELHLQRFFAATLFLCLGATFLHGLLPVVRKGVEHFILALLAASFVINVILSFVSVKLAVRLQ